MTIQNDATTLKTVEPKLEELTCEQLDEATGGAGTHASGGGGGAGKVSMQDFHFVGQLNFA